MGLLTHSTRTDTMYHSFVWCFVAKIHVSNKSHTLQMSDGFNKHSHLQNGRRGATKNLTTHPTFV